MPVDDATMKSLDETGSKMDAILGKPPMDGADKPPGDKPGKSSGDPDLDNAIDSTGYDTVVVNCLKRIGAKLDDKGKATMKSELAAKSDPGMMEFIGKNGGTKDEDFEGVKMGEDAMDEEPSGEHPSPFGA